MNAFHSLRSAAALMLHEHLLNFLDRSVALRILALMNRLCFKVKVAEYSLDESESSTIGHCRARTKYWLEVASSTMHRVPGVKYSDLMVMIDASRPVTFSFHLHFTDRAVTT